MFASYSGGRRIKGWTLKRRGGLKHLSLFMSIVYFEDGQFYRGFISAEVSRRKTLELLFFYLRVASAFSATPR